MARTCLVLGAGATLANAQHFHPETMRNTWPPLDTTFFETVDRRKMAISRALRDYLRSSVGIEPTVTNLREVRMEEAFKDAFYDLDETPDDVLALNGYIDLVELYLRVLRGTTNWLCKDKRRGGPVGKLVAHAAEWADELTIITFNHDLLIENEIAKRARLRKRWCLDEGYGALGEKLAVVGPVKSSPLFPLHRDGACDHARPIRILKLHGSLNWVVRPRSARPTANFLRGKSGNRTIHLLNTRETTGTEIWVASKASGGRARWDTWPVVVPPVYAKQALRAAMKPAWTDARAALGEAERIIFFGYSLPDIDIEAEKLFERGLKESGADWIDVVNPAASVSARIASVSKTKPVRWYPDLATYLAKAGPV